MNRFSLVVTTGLLAALLVGAGGGSAPARATDPVHVYPTPEHIEVVHSPVRLAGRVRVVTTENTDDAALDALVGLLRAQGLDDIDVESPDAPPSRGGESFTVVLGAAEDAPVAAGLDAAELPAPREAESYAMAVSGSRPTPSVVIAGADGAGQFYGVQTLRQLVVHGHGRPVLAGADVLDRPAMPLRGTIEGFYGTPWSHADRLRQFSFLGAHKMNTYVYAPKDDPYHRELWREPYPADKLAELAELVAAADDQHVDFWFAISPGVSVCYSGEADFDALIAKAEQLWDVGVRSFALLLDDIAPVLRCDADRERFGADESPAAAAQAHLLNRFRSEFLAPRSGSARLMTVPTEYTQPAGPTPYKRRFAELVDPDVLVMWTGTSPFGTTDGDDVRDAREAFGHDVLMWDNYPVNDFASNRLFLGPLRGRGADVAEAGMSGYVSNPMNQAAASEIPLFTVADYTWNPAAYDPDTSWDAALREIGGSGYDELRTFAENSQSWYLDREESPRLVAALEAFWRAYESGVSVGGAGGDLQSHLDELERLPGELRDELADEALLEDIGAHLDKLALLARSANAATGMLLEQENGDGEAAWRARATTEAARAETLAMPQEVASQWTEIGKPGRSILDGFVARAVGANDRWLGLQGEGGTHPEPASVWDFDTDGDTEGWVAGNSVDPVSVQGGALITRVTGTDPYLVHEPALHISPSCAAGTMSIEVVLGVEAGGRGQIYWATEASPDFAENKMVAFEVAAGAPATYRLEIDAAGSPLTRLRLDLPDNAGQARVDAVRVLVDRSDPAGSVSGGPPAAEGSSLGLAADRCLATRYRAAREPQEGEALVVDLGQPEPLEGIVVLQDPQTPSTAEVQVRSDDEWQTVGSVGSGYGEVAMGGIIAEAIRLVWASGGAEEPTVAEVIPFVAEAEPVEMTLTGPGGGAVQTGATFPLAVSLTSTRIVPVAGTLDITVPAGWRAEPASAEITIPRGRDIVPQVEISTPSEVPSGTYDLRASFTAVGGHEVTRSIQVQVVPPAGDENLALGGTATASSVELGLPQFVAAHAIDGDPATRWASASSDGEWIQVELAQPARVTKTVLSWETAYGAAYRVQVSDDALSWTTIASVDDGDGGTDELRFDSVEPIRYLRIQGVERGTQYGYSLYELEVYGT